MASALSHAMRRDSQDFHARRAQASVKGMLKIQKLHEIEADRRRRAAAGNTRGRPYSAAVANASTGASG